MANMDKHPQGGSHDNKPAQASQPDLAHDAKHGKHDDKMKEAPGKSMQPDHNGKPKTGEQDNDRKSMQPDHNGKPKTGEQDTDREMRANKGNDRDASRQDANQKPGSAGHETDTRKGDNRH